MGQWCHQLVQHYCTVQHQDFCKRRCLHVSLRLVCSCVTFTNTLTLFLGRPCFCSLVCVQYNRCKRKSSKNWTQTEEQKRGKPGNKATKNTLPDCCRKQLSRKQVDDRKWPCHCKFPNQSHNKLYSTITTCMDTSTKDIHKYYTHVYTHFTTHNIY